jgi:hypothetical protein
VRVLPVVVPYPPVARCASFAVVAAMGIRAAPAQVPRVSKVRRALGLMMARSRS